MTHRYAVALDLRQKRCVVVGGGKVAARKVARLLQAGAEVTVVSPQIDASIRGVQHLNGPFRSDHLAGASLAFAATNDPAVNAAVADACMQRGIWCNVADDPQRSDFHVAPTVQRGGFTLAVHTGGASPALAAAIRQQLETQFDQRWARFAETLQQWRHRAGRQITDQARRRAFLESLASEVAREVFFDKGDTAFNRWAESELAALPGS